MAWLQHDPSRNLHICFRFGGKKFKRSLRTKILQDAEARRSRLEETIRLVEAGRIEVPPGADIPTFLLSDGKLAGRPRAADWLSLAKLFDEFFAALPSGHLEDSTLRGMFIHRRHLQRLLGGRFPIHRLGVDDLQSYVAARSREKGIRGRTVGAATIKKEIVTLRGLWNWAVQRDKIQGRFPSNGVRLPKSVEKPHFQTWDEIQRQITRGGLSQAQQADLWDCLFLRLEEIAELLGHVRESARQPFVYPMFVMAAHTGARRSELRRSQVYDFDEHTATIRERKRVRGKQSTRRVPLSPMLRSVIGDWMKAHPGGRAMFCQVDTPHSKKTRTSPEPLTPDEANDHFKRTLRGSKWENVRG